MKKEKKLASGIAIGLLFGIVVGVLTKNIGLWLGVGIAIGAGVGNSLMHHDNKKGQNGSTPKKQVKVNPKSTSI
jgi:hypothetical protein